jgi:protein gp37
MSDLFHKDVPDSFIVQVFETMALHAPWHIYQVLTKRSSRLINTSLLPQILDRIGTWPAHIWLGVSVENKESVESAIPLSACHLPPPLLALLPKERFQQFCSQCCILSGGGS